MRKKEKNTRLSYKYQDVLDSTIRTKVIVRGALTDEQIEKILERLDKGKYFIPEQVGLPANRSFLHTVNDHGFCEIDKEHIRLTDEKPNVDITAETLFKNFLDVETWDEALSIWGYFYDFNDEEEDDEDDEDDEEEYGPAFLTYTIDLRVPHESIDVIESLLDEFEEKILAEYCDLIDVNARWN